MQVGAVPFGIPQVYQIGLWLFVLMINDLDVNSPHLRKFVDDTTVSEVVTKGITNEAQSIVNQVIEWSHVNRVELNPDKCKELRISFARNPVDRTSKYRQVIGTYCKCQPNIEEAVKNSSKRLNFLVQLKLAKLPPTDLILFYNTCVRSVIDYVQVFYNNLPRYLINELVRIDLIHDVRHVGFAIIMQISYTLLRGQTTRVREVITNMLDAQMICFTFIECLSPK